MLHVQDDTPDEWLPDSLVAPDLIEDWTSGLERAPVIALLDVQQWGTSREYLVQWGDGRPDSWEDESHIPQVRRDRDSVSMVDTLCAQPGWGAPLVAFRRVDEDREGELAQLI
jgi:hypothetical protein